ncbi:MAG: hypothetical protein LBR36_03940 [Bacteroidales bacterium]|jgi:hypothetical protein|nr:hypothetical protein [Bacteroidales bacterium]
MRKLFCKILIIISLTVVGDVFLSNCKTTQQQREKKHKEQVAYRKYKSNVRKHWNRQAPQTRQRMKHNLNTQKQTYNKNFTRKGKAKCPKGVEE